MVKMDIWYIHIIALREKENAKVMNDLDYHAIGTRVRELRFDRGLSQEELAAVVAVSTSFIGHIERGEKIASLYTMSKLATALGTTLDYMVLGIKNRCDQQSCPLYRDLEKTLDGYRTL